MSDLIGRFLSFEEHLGRGLVKFVYYLLIAVMVVMTISSMLEAFFGLFSEAEGDFWSHFGILFREPILLVIAIMLLRVVSEFILAVLSINDNLRQDALSGSANGFETGLTPRPTQHPSTTTVTNVTEPAPRQDLPSDEGEPVKKPVTKKTSKKSTKKATKKAAAPKTDDQGADQNAPNESTSN